MRRTTPTTIGPMIVLSIVSIMGYLTSFRRRCRSAEQYYTTYVLNLGVTNPVAFLFVAWIFDIIEP